MVFQQMMELGAVGLPRLRSAAPLTSASCTTFLLLLFDSEVCGLLYGKGGKCFLKNVPAILIHHDLEHVFNSAIFSDTCMGSII